ncbi:hypothetical protein GCM10010310_76540 [Streptomyces violaceolatus]|uniref:Uncharacterized protein n=1 Tax=Streptomyces violaceolatus TaxID=67378 RepID=A0ABN3THB4_9ACTN
MNDSGGSCGTRSGFPFSADPFEEEADGTPSAGPLSAGELQAERPMARSATKQNRRARMNSLSTRSEATLPLMIKPQHVTTRSRSVEVLGHWPKVDELAARPDSRG